MNTMSYGNHIARVVFDAEDRLFFGRIVGIRDVIGFHADSVGELERAFREAVEDYVDACAKAHKAPERPFSGRVMFRVDPRIHARRRWRPRRAGSA